MTTTTVSKSKELFERAKSSLVGGVNSPVRAFKSIGGDPIFFKRGKGAYLYSEDDDVYIDYMLSWGPLLFGHAPDEVVAAIEEAARKGTSFGAPNFREIELAELIKGFVPSCEMLRFVSSGTEATMSAIRLARGATGRKKIIKFNGGYHGHSDSLLVKAGSGGLTLGIPDSGGVLPEFVAHTLSLEFNSFPELEHAFEHHHRDLACVIVEPVCGNMGVVAGDPKFLERMRELCTAHGVVLIFDEVLTGFRVHPGGAQALYNIKPDLTCLGKVIGGGLPCGAYGGKKELMRMIAPEGPVYQAGTLSGNPVVMAAGMAALRLLKHKPGLFDQAAANTAKLVDGIRKAARALHYPVQVNTVGTMFTVFHCEHPVHNLQDALKSDLKAFSAAYQILLSKGIYCAPSQFEVNFLSSAHTQEDVAKTISAFEAAFQGIKR